MGRLDSLYKYTRLEFINSTINNGIYASSLFYLNDPYEYDGVDFAKDLKVACLSRSRNQKLMWSHYADGHRGCSIKIAIPKNYGNENCPLKRVTYTSKLQLRKGLEDKELVESLYIKDKKWSKELEVRAVYPDLNKDEKYWKRYRDKIFYKAEIKQIDFGCSSHLDNHYLDALTSIRDYNSNHKKKIKVRKYKMSSSNYKFVIDKSFDYIDEINKLTNSN